MNEWTVCVTADWDGHVWFEVFNGETRDEALYNAIENYAESVKVFIVCAGDIIETGVLA